MSKNMKKEWKKMTAIVIVVSLFGSGCATQYVPKRRDFVSVTSKGYERCGQVYKRGMFNQGLVRATEGDAEAQTYAKKSSKNMKWSWGLVGVGIVTLGAGVGLASSSDRNSTAYDVSGGLLVTGIVASLVSLIPGLKSPAQAQDAINKYNDNVALKGTADTCPHSKGEKE